MRKKIIFLTIFLSLSTNAYAQLSSNPWANANNQEDVAKVYEKRQRRGKSNAAEQYYQAEESTVIDRTHAYIQNEDLTDENKDTSLLGKVKGLVSSKPKKETPLIANTADNRRKLAEKKRQQQEQTEEKQESNSLMPSFGSGLLKNNFKLPSFNANGMIRKFEKASGINFKSIGRSLK